MKNKTDKFSTLSEIISQLNKQTSISVHSAESKIEEGNFSEAADLLEKHLGDFPSDSTAQILLGRAYAKLGKYHQAAQQLKSAANQIHSPETLEFYSKEIEIMLKGEKSNLTAENLHSQDFTPLVGNQEIQDLQSGAANSAEPELVSETLANIYVSQGEFKEAIKIYQKLIDRKPENKGKYLIIIDELKSRLE